MFIIASLVSRGLRFFLIGWLIWRFGAPIKSFIDKYFNMLATLFAVLLIGFTALTLWLFGSEDGGNDEATEVVEAEIETTDATTETEEYSVVIEEFKN